jgi:CRISPR-associated protein Cas8a1/Csx13
MAKVKSESTAGRKNEIRIDLFAPGMTALHRVGLAGLWMTLKKFERDQIHILGGNWVLTPQSVSLRWDRGPSKFFKSLFEKSFRVDKNGIIWFAALGRPMDQPQSSVLRHRAILGTFLQHGKTRKSDSSTKPTGALSVEIDGVTLPIKYQKVKSYVHQKAYTHFIGSDGKLLTTHLASWHFPGGAVRHVGLGENYTALEESPERLLPLLYAPVGGIYFMIRRRGEGVRPLFALVIPEIADLEKYVEARTIFLQHGVKELLASGTADAGWRVLATLHAKGLVGSLGSPACRVVSFGVVPWSKQQKTRVDLFTVRVGTEERLRTFNLCRQVLAPRLVRPERGDPFWDVPQTPELIARNLAEGRSWYEGFAEFVSDKGRREHVFTWEKGGLNKMVNESRFGEDREQIFVRACHEAWRRRMGQLGERARREGASFRDLVGREFERLRVGFARCKNAATLRETVTDFWARAGGPLPGLQSGWQELLPLLGEKNWRKAKDLALLALASYQPTSKEEEGALSLSGVTDTGGGKQK